MSQTTSLALSVELVDGTEDGTIVWFRAEHPDLPHNGKLSLGVPVPDGATLEPGTESALLMALEDQSEGGITAFFKRLDEQGTRVILPNLLRKALETRSTSEGGDAD